MTVTIAKNIKKTSIYIDKNGNKIKKEELFNKEPGNNVEQSKGN